MDELHLVGIAFAIYGVGVVLALLFRGWLLKSVGILSAIIAVPFLLIMMTSMGPGTGSSSHGGGGVALLIVFVGPIGLPALGFISGWAAKIVLKEEVNLRFPLNYIGMAVMIFGPFFLLLNAFALQPDLKRNSAKEFANNNTGVPVKLGNNVLSLPIRRGVKFKLPVNKSIRIYNGQTRYDDIEKLKVLIQEGDIDIEYLEIRGLIDSYAASRHKGSKYIPRECEYPEYENLIRCNFIMPEFTLMFGDDPGSYRSKKSETKEPIRIFDGFDIISEKWNEPKTENEKPKLNSFALRDSSIEKLSDVEVHNITGCNRIRDEYLCSAYMYPMNDKPQIKYKFVAKEADIPMTIRETRVIAVEYWNTLVKTYGDKAMENK